MPPKTTAFLSSLSLHPALPPRPSVTPHPRRHKPLHQNPRRRPRPHLPICATTPPPPPPPLSPLDTALNQIRTFPSSPSSLSARTLTTHLINSLAATTTSELATPSGATFSTLFTALRKASFLRAFASHKPPSQALRKAVSPERLAAQAGLPISALSPRKATVFAWQFAGMFAVIAIVYFTKVFGVDEYSKPFLLFFASFFISDQLLLRGALFESVYRTLFPKYTEKVLKHEAGHFLAAYFLGLPVRGYVLSAADALKAGIPGQAGTLFEDEKLFAELRKGILTNSAIDRFSIVSMAGIAAEAVHYGEAEGGESDVAALITMLTSLNPPWNEQTVRDQARWAVLEAVLLLRRNVKAYDALCDAMRERKSLGECILVIEDNFVEPEPELAQVVAAGADEVQAEGAQGKSEQQRFKERESAIVAELERIKKRVENLESE